MRESREGGNGPSPAFHCRFIRGSARGVRLTYQVLRGRPIAPSFLGGGGPFTDRIRKSGIFDRACVVRKDGPAGVAPTTRRE